MSYRTIKLLNKGSSGKVYLVRHEKSPYKLFAMKAVPKTDVKHLFMAQNEVKHLKRVQPHPYIVGLHDVIETPTHVNIIQELCGGPTLQQSMYYQEIESFHENVRGVISALTRCHENDFVYGDLKPQNVVFSTKDMKYKLTDFGSSAEIDPTTKHALLMTSTPEIAAPEVFKLATPHVTTAYDVWSLGVLIKTMYAALNIKMSGVEDFIERCMCRDPKERIKSGDLMGEWERCNLYYD